PVTCRLTVWPAVSVGEPPRLLRVSISRPGTSGRYSPAVGGVGVLPWVDTHPATSTITSTVPAKLYTATLPSGPSATSTRLGTAWPARGTVTVAEPALVLTAIAPVYHPPARPAGFTVTDTGVEAPTAVLPPGGETLSQVPPELVVAVALQLRLPVPWLVMVNV